MQLKPLLTSPLVYLSRFKDSYKQIVYFRDLENYKDQYIRTLCLVDHDEYLQRSTYTWERFPYCYKNTEYAYGILINPFKSKLFVLDFDLSEPEIIEKIIGIFASLDSFIGADIVKSSQLKIGHYHLYIAFDDYYNTCELYNRNYPTACRGFLEKARQTNEVVLRVSNKFSYTNDASLDHYTTAPTYSTCIRKSVEGKFFAFTSFNIVLPADTESKIANYSVNECEQTKVNNNKLKLRGIKHNGKDNAIKKSQRQKITTVGCIKDLNNLSISKTQGCS